MKLYVARDKSEELYLYENEPIKVIDHWDANYGDVMPIDWGAFPEIRWEDAEPTEVELVIKKKYDKNSSKSN